MDDKLTIKAYCATCEANTATVAILNSDTGVIEQRCATCQGLRADQRSYRTTIHEDTASERA